MITELRTERLTLRTVGDDDVDRMLEYRARPEVTRWPLSTEVDPAHAGHGYATEAVTAVVTHAVDTLGVRRVRAGCSYALLATTWQRPD